MTYNLNKLFHFLSLRSKLVIAFSLLSFVPLALVGSMGIYRDVRSVKEVALADLADNLTLFKERSRGFLQEVQLDLQHLSRSATLSEYRSALGRKSDPEVERARKAVLDELLAFAESKNNYYRIRCFGEDPDEHLGVQFGAGVYSEIPRWATGEWRPGSLSEALAGIENGRGAFSAVELTGDDGMSVPAISFRLPLRDAGGSWGVLLADIFAESLFEACEMGTHPGVHGIRAIITGNGRYFHRSGENIRSKRTDGPERQTFFDDFPAEVTEAALSGTSGVVKDKSRIVAYAPLFDTNFENGSSYFIIQSVDKALVLRPARQLAGVFAGLLVVFLAVSIGFGYLATRQIAGPIRQLQEGAEIVAGGNYDHRLKIETNDEIELLARQFNYMAEALSQREQLLAEQQKRLEERVVRRTDQLNEEKEKLQAVLDNVPSAFVLIDEDGRIVSASAAIKSIIGISPQEAIGKMGREVLPRATPEEVRLGQERRSSFVPSVTSVRGANGRRRYIEHASIPVDADAGGRATLEILTDVTERKSLETHMLRAEKLAATGEMAATIAHEIRNSLTSVKMILQLQREASTSHDEIQSLDIAMKSLLRTEEVVSNLLRFARPSDLELLDSDVNDLINESLIFVRGTAEKRSIRIVERLSPGLPRVHADAQQLKEAFVNILLNAAQAIESGGQIEVASRKTRLEKRIENDVYTTNSRNSGGAEQDVVLEEGAEVIDIRVRDSGPGIPEDRMDRIFDPFYTTKLEGTGLGLAVVKRTINLHGGAVVAGNSPGGGAVFRVLLPIGGTS